MYFGKSLRHMYSPCKFAQFVQSTFVVFNVNSGLFRFRVLWMLIFDAVSLSAVFFVSTSRFTRFIVRANMCTRIDYSVVIMRLVWLGGVMVRASDLRLEIAGSIPAAALSSATLDKLFTHFVRRLCSYDLMALYKSV